MTTSNRQRLGLMVALAAAAALAGACSGSAAPTSSSSTPSTATVSGLPSSASPTPTKSGQGDDKQVAIAAFNKYWSELDTILHDGGSTPLRIRPYARGQAVAFAIDLAGNFRKNGYKLAGKALLINTTATKVTTSKPQDIGISVPTVVITSCQDSHAGRLVRDGKTLPVPSAPRYYPYTATAVKHQEVGRQLWTLDQFKQGAAVDSCP